MYSRKPGRKSVKCTLSKIVNLLPSALFWSDAVADCLGNWNRSHNAGSGQIDAYTRPRMRILDPDAHAKNLTTLAVVSRSSAHGRSIQPSFPTILVVHSSGQEVRQGQKVTNKQKYGRTWSNCELLTLSNHLWVVSSPHLFLGWMRLPYWTLYCV